MNIFLQANDDEKEKLEYRRRLAAEEEAERKKSIAGFEDGRRSFGGHLPALTAQQLSEHYNNCLQLFNENVRFWSTAITFFNLNYLEKNYRHLDKFLDKQKRVN